MKEYNDRNLKPLVNPPITNGEYESQLVKDGKRPCQECGEPLDTVDRDVDTCFECYSENFRKGN